MTIISVVYCILMIWLSEGITKLSGIQNKDFSEYKHPKISVVVAARNEEQNIAYLLDSLKNQSYPIELVEIIISDDRSTDNTQSVIEHYKKEMSNLVYIKIEETPLGWSHKKWALNTAINQSKGELILLTDADCIPTSNWIKTIINGFSDANTAFISAPTPLFAVNPIQELMSIESNAQDAFSAGGLGHGIIFSCAGRNIAIRRSVFDEISGFDGIEHLPSGDDDLLMHKISKMTKYKIHFIMSTNSIVYSSPPNSITGFFKQRLRFASKGLFYYQWSADISLRTVLPLLYITNIFALISLTQFTATAAFIWLLPWMIKSSGDAVITYNYLHKLKLPWKLTHFILLSIIHPLYVVVLGGLGPFTRIQWKG